MKDKKRFKKIKAGKKEAFENLFRKYYEDLVHFVWSYVGSESIAKELVQDIFLTVWEEGRELNIETSVKAYLFSTARNMSIDYLRHQEVKLEWCEEKQALFNPESLPQPDERLHKKMLLEEIKEAIQELPEKRREIFIMSRYQQMSYEEIAEFLDISVNTVKTQMSRSLKTLRKIIDTLSVMHTPFLLSINLPLL